MLLRGNNRRNIELPDLYLLLKKITYKDFDSREWTSFTCTLDHRITRTATGTRPYVSGTAVIWPTSCDRKHTAKEACDLYLVILSDYFYHDLMHGDDHP
ncbi:hypothetical protein V1525DRAFT_264975 [Lipomyces kononenkoae]|uniref:Uncharacterized protein n=1 Tax=Lipomyces kononenkoae TaxID=34357 RepID=A0ACC3T7V5_LIPKO